MKSINQMYQWERYGIDGDGNLFTQYVFTNSPTYPTDEMITKAVKNGDENAEAKTFFSMYSPRYPESGNVNIDLRDVTWITYDQYMYALTFSQEMQLNNQHLVKIDDDGNIMGCGS